VDDASGEATRSRHSKKCSRKLPQPTEELLFRAAEVGNEVEGEPQQSFQVFQVHHS